VFQARTKSGFMNAARTVRERPTWDPLRGRGLPMGLSVGKVTTAAEAILMVCATTA
jgi:hypothetical protein